jgi:hypothetical protein
MQTSSISASEHGAKDWKKFKVDGAPRDLAESHRLERFGPQPGTDRPVSILLRFSATCQRVIQPNITFLDQVICEPYGSSSSHTRPSFSDDFSYTLPPTPSRPIDPYNTQYEVNPCYFCSGIPSLGHDMLTSSNRISHYLVDTNSLLLPKPLRISKPPDINRIPNPTLRRKNPLRSCRRHPELPQIPALLHLLQRHQTLLSRR